MTVTKQQQLERISRIIPKWNDAYLYAELMTNPSINMTVYRFTDNPSGDNAFITRAEWYIERDRQAELKAMTMQMCELKPLELGKMQKKQDNSWHERGELPPVGCECEVNHENGSGWIRAKVISITSEYAILLNEGSAGEYPAKLSKTKLRPLDYEKTLFVSGIVEMASGGLISTESAREFAVKLFDSGYRKTAQ